MAGTPAAAAQESASTESTAAAQESASTESVAAAQDAAEADASIQELETVQTVQADEAITLPETARCSMVLPRDYVPGDTPGSYVSRNAPMDSSNVLMRVTDTGAREDAQRTNAQKKVGSYSVVQSKLESLQNLTAEVYEDRMNTSYESAYGKNVHFQVSTLFSVKIDGCPGYRIEASYQDPDTDTTIKQIILMLMSSNHIYTITFSRAEDDDAAATFEKIIDSIRIQ